MKTKVLFIYAFIMLATSGVLAQRGLVKDNIQVASFTAITASGGWDVFVSQGDKQSVSIEVSENDIDNIIIEVRSGTLHLSNKSRNRVFSIFDSENSIRRAYITVTDLKEITASGGVDINFRTPLRTEDFEVTMSGGTDLEDLTLYCTDFSGKFSGGCDANIQFASAESIRVNASGGSDVELSGINAERVRVSASGGCDVELSGRTDELIVNASGGCDVSASDLVAVYADLNFSDAADGKIHVKDRLDIEVNGASDVVCYGNPREVNERVGRSSSFRLR